MPHIKPFHRIYRRSVANTNSGYSNWAFIVDKEYANSPHHYTRAFLILQKDIQNLFEYIEPADINLPTFSYKIHELLMRTCIELESNFKAILRENIYTPTNQRGQSRNEDSWNINDFIKINKSHHLDNYFVEFPFWRGHKYKYQPFLDWATNSPLSWYQAYNKCKHDRNGKFESANFETLLNAFAGLFVLLSSQFKCEDFIPGGHVLELQIDNYFEGTFGIGGFLKIEFPTNWDSTEEYDFDWSILKGEQNRFKKFDYNSI